MRSLGIYMLVLELELIWMFGMIYLYKVSLVRMLYNERKEEDKFDKQLAIYYNN